MNRNIALRIMSDIKYVWEILFYFVILQVTSCSKVIFSRIQQFFISFIMFKLYVIAFCLYNAWLTDRNIWRKNRKRISIQEWKLTHFSFLSIIVKKAWLVPIWGHISDENVTFQFRWICNKDTEINNFLHMKVIAAKFVLK